MDEEITTKFTLEELRWLLGVMAYYPHLNDEICTKPEQRFHDELAEKIRELINKKEVE